MVSVLAASSRCLLAAALVAVPAAARVPVVRIAAPPFIEFNPHVEPATSEPFIAASTDAGAGRRKPSHAELTVSGILPEDRILCVAVRSADGTYRASVTIPNPQLGPIVTLALPSEGPVRAGLASIKIPARVQAARGVRCSPADPILPAGWGGGGSQIGLVMNSEGTQVTLVAAATQPSGCARLRDVVGEPLGNVSNLDTVCRVPSLPACGSELALAVQMREGSDFRRTAKVRVRGVCRSAGR